MDSPSAATARTLLPVGLLVTLVLAAGAAPTAAHSSGQSDGPSAALAQTQVDADTVLLSVDIASDGTAAWRIEHRVRLDDENSSTAFDELEADVEANESAYVTRFEDRLAPTVQDAATATGRTMALRNVSVTTTTQQLPQTYGVLVYTFEWTNFAVVESDQLRAGDALAGLFLDTDTSLLIAWPEGYALTEVSPEPTEERERSVIWRGPTDFGPGEPAIVVSTGGSADGVDTSFIGLVIVALVLVGGAGVMWWRSRPGVGRSTAPTGDQAADGRAGTPASESSRPPDELLSNEERVIALLEGRGGRMKQQDVVEALGWTDAKTSQVVGKLRDAGDIEGFRLGRENVLRLPDVDESPAPGEIASEQPDEDG
jgi:hypothetical protein